MKRFEPTEWTVAEVLERDADGNLDPENGSRPFSKELAAGGDQLTSALRLMWTVAFHGWPEAKQKMKDSHGRLRIVLADEKDGNKIWELKATPNCWRLYFHVYEKQKAFVYLHAVCKKKTKQKAASAKKARNRFNKIRAGGDAPAEFEFSDPEGL